MELSKTYDPASVERKWYARWLERNDFRADEHSSKPPFSIVIPPPNITGVLTLGHVLNNTIQDILARRARMMGCEVLWLPGTDHAGVATQTAVEKSLRKEEKLTRHDLGRDEFIRRTWEWQKKHGRIIIDQLKRLGCSCDWTRERFTLDPGYALAVQKVFVELYNRGLIYRGRRMINWDPAALTALSDEEVISTPQKSTLFYVRYEIVEEPGRFLEVATTRPETIMADTAVAVHPTDERYRDLIGKKHVWRPLAREKLPIVGDEAIDPKFGTGVLKVTPAHDKTDFEIGQRHNLPLIDVLHPDGRINCPAVPELDGLDRFVARKKAAELLAQRGLLAKEEPYENNIGFSERAGVPIEPRISEQWFLRYPKTREALAVVREHLIRFFPAHWEKVYAQWLENIQDWCISRQIWWGHRIPVWHKRVRLDEQNWTNELLRWGWDDYVEQSWADEPEPIVIRIFRCSDGTEIEAKATPKYTPLMPVTRSEVGDYDIFVCTANEEDGRSFEKYGFIQTADTLDTWFSSWLWAFETMDAETRKKFYPTSVLVTAPDIIFFWVARMIIAGLELKPGKSDRAEDNIPFHDVYFTGLIRDRTGRKMSKSLGNSPDPIELIDRYGADGLRFGLMRIAPSGQDIRFDEKQIEEGRNFATKLWNAARFRQMHGPSSGNVHLNDHDLSIYALEVLARLNETIEQIDAAYREYKFNEVAQRLYDFFWSDYCDWFIEAAKTDIFSENEGRRKSVLAVMDVVLSATLRLLHPFMPFITEEVWSVLGLAGEGSIQFAPPPEKESLDNPELIANARKKVKAIYEAVQAGRNLRAESKIPSSKKARFILRASADSIADELPTISRFLNAEELLLDVKYQTEPGIPVAATSLGELFLIIGGADKQAEADRLDKEIAKLETELRTVNTKLAKSAFIDNAPVAVVEEHKRRKTDFTKRLAQLRKARAALR